jgi:beta-xylosidase
MKRFLFCSIVALFATGLFAQGVKPLPTLHVEGKWLVDTHGNHVVLHGVTDTPNMCINGWRWGAPSDDPGTEYNSAGATKCLEYFEKLLAGMEEAHCTVFRLQMDPAWSNDPSEDYVYSGSTGQEAGISEEADIKKFNPTRLKSFITSLYWPLIQKAMNHGMYVVVSQPGVCPDNMKVGDYYNDYLMTVWDTFTQNANIRKYSGQISIELANKPVSLKSAGGEDDTKALHDFFQPIVDKIRSNGFTGIVWVPGSEMQADFTGYAAWPIEGYNIGYAVHDYCGWYGSSDDTPDPQTKIDNFHKQVPVVDTNPIIVTEVDWSPENPSGEGHYDEHGNWVLPNYGTKGTGSTSKWGKAYKAMLDNYGNISMTLSGTGCLLDVDTLINNNKVVPAFGGREEACGKACMDWYAEYYDVDWAHADFKQISVSDLGPGKYKNPIVFADFPDPDVIRVDDTYYMVTTTMHHFPGCTMLKSKDMVNWEYCAQPLEQLATTDRYNLLNGKNAYAAGMWACSMTWHDGKFYILINGNDAGGYVLSASNPEGVWEKKQLSRIYYDPGMLFDNGKVYVACGIGNIQMCELDENFNFIKEKRVISDKDGLEGSHLYKIGDYYYIYATYGGWPSGQAVFRSKNIFGPYEEKMLLEKNINGKANTIHQGALIETQTGEWWTILQQDLGAMGRMPNLQPVKWNNDWPEIGNKGIPYSSYTKPKVGTTFPRSILPTSDNFRSYPIGMQWQWNHNPDNAAWSLFERPGWLRLRASSTADRLTQARNMLTQRIFAFHDKPNVPSTGTIRLDLSNLKEGDRAGICILQDPYAAIAVEVKDGKKQVIWWQDQLTQNSGFTPSQATATIPDASPSGNDNIIYLRAEITYGTSKTMFYYSTDGVTFKPLGKQTTLGFNLSVFVGARFGLFCYNTGATVPAASPSGYADFDWFTTESEFSEADFYPEEFEGYGEDILTATELTLPDVQGDIQSPYEVMVGNSAQLQVIAKYRDGHTDNVAAQADYQTDANGVIEINNGQIIGLKEGTTTVTVSYTDPKGNTLTTQFTVKSTFFPFGKQYIKTDFFSNGTYSESTHTFKPGQYGQMGWEYPNGADMSAYKYLVINLKTTSTNSHLNIYTENSIWSPCFSTPDFGSKKQIVVNLQTAKYTSDGDKKGKPLDTKNIHIVSFWGMGDKTIVVDDMYLTNNSDYTREEDTQILAPLTSHTSPINIYTLSGQLLRRAANSSSALQGLPAGIYIVGQKKIIVK